VFFSYHKFTRGKDLTQYKREELTCILGKGVKDDGQILNGLNMKEYFKSKKERSKIQKDKYDTSSSVEDSMINNNDDLHEKIVVKEDKETETENELNTTLLKKNKRRAKHMKETDLVLPNYDDIQLEKKKKKTKELSCENIEDIESLKKKTKKSKLPINEDLDDNSEENNKTIEENDADVQESELVLTQKYQNLVDLLIENSSAGKKYCKDSTNPLFEEKMKEFTDNVKHQLSTTVCPADTKSSLKKNTTTLKPIILNPDGKNFINDFEEQKSKTLEIISKRQQLAKYVNEKSMFIANHGDVLFFGSNINDIKGYGEW